MVRKRARIALRPMTDGAHVPRVTVVIPARNSERFLAEALESVLAQSYSDWEAVVADDASTDRSYELAQQFAAEHPERIRAIRLERNSGPAVARNAAIAASQGGELIALLDSDDRWLSAYLERMVGLYDASSASGKSVGIVGCNALLADAKGIDAETFADRSGWDDPVTYEGMLERSTLFVSALFPRAVFSEVGGFSPDCWGSEDYDLWLRIIESGYEVVVTKEPLVVYRVHEAGLSRSQLRMANAGIAAYERALGRSSATPSQRRLLRKRLRHYRALRARALVQEAFARRRRRDALLLSLRATPAGLLAFLQEPRRWREWLLDAQSAAGSALRDEKRPPSRNPRAPGPRPRA
jgi:teichuronic acid biosynthesis glycosyltransferase TuaG